MYIHNDIFRFAAFDRSGGVQSIPYSLRDDKLIFLRLILGILFAEDKTIGFDPSIQINVKNDVKSIQLNNQTYVITKKLIATQSLRGRATHVWVAQDPARKSCIVKDCWIGGDRTHNEIDILNEIKGMPSVPNIIHGELVLFDDETDSTAWLRTEYAGFTDFRFHLRIAMNPIGEPLCHFSNQKELVGIFLDIFTGQSLFLNYSWKG